MNRYLCFIILSALFLFLNSCATKKVNQQIAYSQNDILDYLEDYNQETYHFFIDLEHPYFFTAGSRLTLYADETRWAIVFEKSGYSTGSSSAQIEFAYFGNCLMNLKSEIPGDVTTSNMSTAHLIDNRDLENIEDGFELVSKKINQIKVEILFYLLNTTQKNIL